MAECWFYFEGRVNSMTGQTGYAVRDKVKKQKKTKKQR